MNRKICIALALFFCAAALHPGRADAAMDSAYLVVQDKNLEAAAPLIKYIRDSGTGCVLVKPEDMPSVNGMEYFIVIGSPGDNDELAAFAKENLSSRQWSNATEMGKSGPLIVQAGDSQVLFLFSDYSLKSLVSGSKDRWTEIFYDWYDIPLSITQIIGY